MRQLQFELLDVNEAPTMYRQLEQMPVQVSRLEVLEISETSVNNNARLELLLRCLPLLRSFTYHYETYQWTLPMNPRGYLLETKVLIQMLSKRPHLTTLHLYLDGNAFLRNCVDPWHAQRVCIPALPESLDISSLVHLKELRVDPKLLLGHVFMTPPLHEHPFIAPQKLGDQGLAEAVAQSLPSSLEYLEVGLISWRRQLLGVFGAFNYILQERKDAFPVIRTLRISDCRGPIIAASFKPDCEAFMESALVRQAKSDGIYISVEPWCP